VIIRASAYLAAIRPPGEAAAFWLPVPDLYTTLNALLASLTDRAVVTGPAVSDLLYPEGLAQIPDAGPSHGANLLANPALDLAEQNERRIQVDDWLQQIGLDAGLNGMEKLLDAYHQEHG
jgi:hypothetical protein